LANPASALLSDRWTPNRNAHVKSNESFASIREKYLDLYRICRVTRYDADPDTWLPQEYVNVNDLVHDLLAPIEANLGLLLGKTASGADPLRLED
jgi:hypothetical protein